MNTDLRSVWTALRQGSPVVVGVPAELRFQLLRRYVEASVRNSHLALVGFALILFGVAYEAPLAPRVAAFAVLAAVTLLRSRLAREMERRMDPADPRTDWRHDLLVLAAMLGWGLMPFGFVGHVSATAMAVVVYGGLIALTVLAVSYIAALPACVAALAFTVVPLVSYMLTRGTYLDAMMALATAIFGVSLQERLRASHRTLLEALGAQRENAALVKELHGYREQLERENAVLGDSLRDANQAAVRDPLTGAYNRRYLVSAERTLARPVHEEQEAVTIGVVDIDYFKRVNDCHGHLVGDQVLREVAQLLAARLRERDCLVRFGGEEFVVVLRRCDIRRARRVAEALRHNVASAEIETDAGVVPITVSVGLAQWLPGERLDAAIARADRSLYVAKQGGRDRVEIDGLTDDYATTSFAPTEAPSTLPSQLH